MLQEKVHEGEIFQGSWFLEKLLKCYVVERAMVHMKLVLRAVEMRGRRTTS